MTANRKLLYAAFTGDVVTSTPLDTKGQEKLRETLSDTAREFRTQWPDLLINGISPVFGGGLQFLIKDASKALRTALYFRAGIKSAMEGHADMRIGIGVGTIDILPEENKGGADGEAYILSASSFSAMRDRQSMAFSMSVLSAPHFADGLETAVVLSGTVADRWSLEEALAVKGALAGHSVDEICEVWPNVVTGKAVDTHLDFGSWYALDPALRFFETKLLEGDI